MQKLMHDDGRMLADADREELRRLLATRSPPGHRPHKLSEKDRRQLVKAFMGGASVASLADAYGVVRQTIEYHLRRAAR